MSNVALLAIPSSFDRRALGAEAEAFISRATVMIRRARVIVEQDRRQLAGLLAARRGELCRHLGSYQRFKHGRIFDPIIVSGGSSSQIVARSMKIDCVMMGETFSHYHQRWATFEDEDWLSYRLDMLATSAKLLAFLEAEQRAINQLLVISEFYETEFSQG